MKLKSLLIIALCAAVPALACAKKPKVETPAPAAEPEVTEEEPVITEECLMNISLFNESVKNKQYQDAYNPWWSVYTTCPSANKVIYTKGSDIVEYMYNQATDPAEKDRYRKLALELCDKRIKYFGDDPRYPKAYILGQKGVEYCKYYPEDETKEIAYPWLKESVLGMKEKSQVSVLTKLAEVSYALYKSNPEKYGEQFLADYSKVSELLQVISKDPTNKSASVAGQQKDYVDNLFAISGAAECSKLDEIYADIVNANLNNLEELLKYVRLYKRVNCTESDVYFAASEAAHKLQPSEESATGCARMCMKKEDWRGAIAYYNEALRIDDETIEDDGPEDNADYLFNIAYIYFDKLKNYPEARSYCRRSLELLPNQGRCYILIGSCYAAAKPYSTTDYPAAKAAILNKTVFWAAVDQFARAKSIDPSVTSDADKLIYMYSKYFPTKEEMFDLPNELGGSTFIVGGWINEKTVCRPAK